MKWMTPEQLQQSVVWDDPLDEMVFKVLSGRSVKDVLAEADHLSYEEIVLQIVEDDDLWDLVAAYHSADPDSFENRPEETRRLIAILKRLEPFRPRGGGVLYRGEPEQSRERQRGLRSWTSNRRTAEQFAKDYGASGVVRVLSRPMQAVSIEDLVVARMRLRPGESHFPGEQAEWLVLD